MLPQNITTPPSSTIKVARFQHICAQEKIFSSFSSQDRVPAPLNAANRALSQLPALKDQGGKAFRTRMCSVQIFDKQLITGHSSVRTRATATVHYIVNLHIACSHPAAKHYNTSVLNDQGGKISAHMCSGEIFSSFSSQDRVPAPLNAANRAQSQLPALKDQGGKAFRTRMCSVQIFDKQLITGHSSVRTRATATVHYIVNLHIACSHAAAKHNNTSVLNDQGGKISAHMCSGEIFSSFLITGSSAGTSKRSQQSPKPTACPQRSRWQSFPHPNVLSANIRQTTHHRALVCENKGNCYCSLYSQSAHRVFTSCRKTLQHLRPQRSRWQDFSTYVLRRNIQQFLITGSSAGTPKRSQQSPKPTACPQRSGWQSFPTRMCSVQIFDKQLITGDSSVRTRATATVHYSKSAHRVFTCCCKTLQHLRPQRSRWQDFSTYVLRRNIQQFLITGSSAGTSKRSQQSPKPTACPQRSKWQSFRTRMCSVQIFDKQLISGHSSVRTRATATVHYIVNLYIAFSHAAAKHCNTCILNDQGGKISAHMCSGEIFSSFSSQDRVPAPLNAANRAQSQLPALKDQGGKAFRTRMCSVQIFDKQLITGHSSVRTRATATVHYIVNLHIACSHPAAKHNNTSVLNDQGGKISAHMVSGEIFSSFSSQDRVPAPLNAAKSPKPTACPQRSRWQSFRTRMCLVQIFDKQLITGHLSVRTKATPTIHYIIKLHIACSHLAAESLHHLRRD